MNYCQTVEGNQCDTIC